jgi:hypothetical protein
MLLTTNFVFFLALDCVQLGFLPRNVAKWVSPLWDIGFFRFSGYVCPKEALAAALGGNCIKVQLILHVSQVCYFCYLLDIVSMIHNLQLYIERWHVQFLE